MIKWTKSEAMSQVLKYFPHSRKSGGRRKDGKGQKKKQDAAFASIIDERTGTGDECVSESLQRGKGRKLVWGTFN